MVDWDKSTGSSGTMRIRDTGTYVEFWITAGNSSTFSHSMPWKYTVNGSTSAWQSYDYKANSGFEMLGRWNVTTNQTVTFYLGDTGTSGLGGPTTFSHAISRASAPSPPTTPKLSNITSSSIDVTFSDGANNGAAIDSRQIGYGRNPSTLEFTTSSDRSTTIGLLSSGTTWYFWARTHNSAGWSPWSGRASAATLRVPDAPSSVMLSNVKPTSVTAIFTDNEDGGSPILESQIGYGTNSTEPENFLTANALISSTIGNLSPGLTYYFWARSKNSVGWGPWSVSSSVKLIAGAYIKVGAVWKRAVPYVKVNGTWKLAKAWGRVAGTWRETL